MEKSGFMPPHAAGLILIVAVITAASWMAQGILDGGQEEMKIEPALIERMVGGDEEIPVIAIFQEGALPTLDGLSVDRTFHLIDGAAITASPEEIRGLAQRQDIKRVYLDGIVQVAAPLGQGNGQSRLVCPSIAVNADRLWAEGLDGSGVTVAVLDSGIDKNHPDLTGKVVGEVNFVKGEETTRDLLGHGTLCAGIIAGSGAASGGKYRGVAPGATLLNVRVIDSTGNGKPSDIIAGIEWALDNGADVLSLSLGGTSLGETNPPVTMAADNAMESGVVVCVSAGNNG